MPRRGHFLVWPPAGISPHGHLTRALQARKSVLPQGRPPPAKYAILRGPQGRLNFLGRQSPPAARPCSARRSDAPSGADSALRHLARALQAGKSVLPQGCPPQNMPFCGAPKGDWISSAGKARLRRGLAPQGARTRHPARTQPCAISPVPCKPGNPFCRRAS